MATQTESVDLVDSTFVLQFALALLFAVMMGAAAYVNIPIPFSPVAITLQVLIVLLAGLYLGPLWGSGSMILYLVAGALGIPVYAGGTAGLGALVGVSAGFLWTFPLAALLIGMVVHRGVTPRNPAETTLPVLVVVLIAAVGLIYAGGAGYYAWLTNVSINEGVQVMVAPFVVGDALKIAIAIAIVKSDTIEPPT